MRLDHIIKERYPTFVDALRDLDDALSMLFLFANLPSTAEVPAKIIAKCQRLTLEFEHYLIRTHSLRKSFLSIKGIYYQATIQGQDILWLVPYKFVQRTGADVDYRIMATFVEFYTTLLGFVNFRLYTSIGLVYPPTFDSKSEEQGAELGAFQLEPRNGEEQQQIEGAMDVETNEKAQAEADRLLSLPEEQSEQNGQGDEADGVEDAEENPSSALDTFASIDEKADTLLQPSATADSETAGKLFENFTVFLSREAPRNPLEFILKAFGCKRVGWDSSLGEPGAYCSEDDTRITHQVVDRPDIPLPSPPLTDGEVDMDVDEVDGMPPTKSNERVPGRIYVQPQWVWDSINAGQLQRPDLYAPGATLPPHLSPWVKAKRGAYDPTLSLAEQETAAEAEMEDEEDEIEEGKAGEEVEGVRGDGEARKLEEALKDEEDGGMDVNLAGSEDDESEDDEVEPNGEAAVDEAEWGGLSGDEVEDIGDSAARQAQAELEAEALGRTPAPASTSAKDKRKKEREVAQAKRKRDERERLEDIDRRKGMASRKFRKSYEKMAYSNARTDEEAEKLRAKRRKIERGVVKS